MSEKIIVLHPENQPEVDIYPIIKEGSIPNSVIDNQKIKSRTIINSNIALNTLKYEVLHQTLKDLIDSKITQANMENYLTSYYYNVEETQQYVGSEINTLHQTIQNEFYSNTTIDNMLMEKTDLSLFRQYLPSTYLNLDKQQDNQTSKLNIHANGSIFLMNSGNKTNSGNYYLPNSIVKTEDAPNGYYVLSTTNDDYQSLYNLGAYDKITTNDDGTYTITRQTGYVDLGSLEWEWTAEPRFSVAIPVLKKSTNVDESIQLVKCGLYKNDGSPIGIGGYGKNMTICSYDGIVYITNTSYTDTATFKGAMSGIILQYELATSYTEKVEKNHYATYNQKFILDHNKSEAERSANLTYATSITNTSERYQPCIILAPFDYKKGVTYTLSFDTENTGCVLYLASQDDLGLAYMSVTTDGTRKSFTFTMPKDVSNYIFTVRNNSTDGKSTGTCSSVMLNIGSTPLPYQAYEGKTIHEKDLENTKNEINNAKQDKLLNEINIKSINGNSILGSGSLNIVADGVYTKITEGVNYYDLEWGKTYKIKMNSDSYAYCSAIPNIKFYGTFEITNFSIRYSDQGSGVGIVGPEYDYIISVSGNRYLASQGQDVKRGASATTHSKPPIRLSAYGGSTFAVYLLN